MPNWCSNRLVVSENIAPFSKWLSEGGFSFERVSQTPPDLLEGDGWYDWRVQNWGTKWDVNPKEVDAEEFGGQIVLNFNTAWSPPENALQKLSEMFPDALFELSYFEPGMCFAGTFTAQGGHLNDNYTEDSESPLFKELAEVFGFDMEEAE